MPPILVLFEINEKLKKENTIIKEKTKTEINPEAKPTSWLCKNCGEVNPAESTACRKCFTTRK
jgi:ribosomal protein L40E